MYLLIALIILDLLAIWALIVSRKVNWIAIVVALVVVSFFNFTVANSFGSGSGWPLKADPAPGLFLGCVVTAPTAIYILEQPTKQQHPRIGYTSPVGAPRLYQLPYSQQLEAMCNKAQKAAGQGVPIAVGKKKSGTSPGSPGTHVPKIRLYPLPPAALGTKP